MTEENTPTTENKEEKNPKTEKSEKNNSNKIVIIIVVLLGLLIVFGIIASSLLGWMGKKVGEEIIEDIIEDSSGEDVDIDIDDDEFTFKSEDGSMEITEDGMTFKDEDSELATGSAAKLPSNWPSSFPEYSDADLLSSSTSSGMMSVVYESNDSVSDIAEYYEQELDDEGYTLGDSLTATNSTIYDFEDDNYTGQISIYSYGDDNEVNIAISLEEVTTTDEE